MYWEKDPGSQKYNMFPHMKNYSNKLKIPPPDWCQVLSGHTWNLQNVVSQGAAQSVREKKPPKVLIYQSLGQAS